MLAWFKKQLPSDSSYPNADYHEDDTKNNPRIIRSRQCTGKIRYIHIPECKVESADANQNPNDRFFHLSEVYDFSAGQLS